MTTPRRDSGARKRHRQNLAHHKPECHLCGKPIDFDLPHTDPMSFEVDHIVPISAGGSSHSSNVAASHKACNRAKGDRTEDMSTLRRSGSLARRPSPPGALPRMGGPSRTTPA
ncbi:HNH endonuclease [Micromonospora coerulea]|uniref:HNH endonuclease n=1 Tax=Micromonospora coerulea TaxID=47856 RepID=UPI0019079ED4|nr:HNH endonuclease [Micromonospora veneta]